MGTYKDVLILVDKVSAPLKKIQNNTDKMRDGLGKLQTGIKKAGAAFTAIGATIGVVGGAILRGAGQVAEMGDRIDKMSQKIGMSRKNFQEWDYIMSQNGGNVETLQMGFKTLTTQIEGVQKGSKDSINAFKALGISVKDNAGNYRDQNDIFNDSIRALQKIENPTQKAILANRLFGRSAAELRPLLNQQAEAIDKLRKKSGSFVLSDEDINNAVKYKDTMDTFTRFFQAKFAGVMMKLMPQLSQTLDDLMAFGAENQEIFDNIGVAFTWVVTKALPATIKAVVTLANWLRNIGGFIGELVANIISIPDYISIAFSKLQISAINVFAIIKQWIQSIIEKIVWIIGKIPGVSKLLGGAVNSVKQIQNNNNTTTTNNITNNYGNTYNSGGFTPLASAAYAI